MTCMEWWVTEALSVLAGLISVKTQVACVIINSLSMILSYITLGFSLASSAMIGERLGQRRIAEAKEMAAHGILICYSYIVSAVVVITVYKESLISFIIEDPEVVKIATGAI